MYNPRKAFPTCYDSTHMIITTETQCKHMQNSVSIKLPPLPYLSIKLNSSCTNCVLVALAYRFPPTVSRISKSWVTTCWSLGRSLH